jgi:nucleotide-binding universal stress UspA family protein
MSYKRIIIATDGSPTAETAEQMAVLLAKATKGKLTIVHGYGNPEEQRAAQGRAADRQPRPSGPDPRALRRVAHARA